MAKSDCMLAIVWLLSSRGQMTAKELAEALEISVRSVYRYVDSLCASGVPIEAESGHQGGYRLRSSYEQVPLFFTTEEKTALAHSALFAKNAGYPFTSSLTSALRKIEHFSTSEQNEDLSLHSLSLDVVTTVDHSGYANILADLQQATTYGKSVHITYRKAKSDADEVRQIDPYGVIHWRDHWYVVAHCHLRQDIRIFRVDRMSACTETSTRFVRPDGFSATHFFVDRQLTATTNEDKLQRVLIRGDTDAIADLARHWFFGPRLVSQSPHEALFLMEESTLGSYVPHILLPFGRSVRVISPDSVKNGILQLLRDLASYYEEVDASHI